MIVQVEIYTRKYDAELKMDHQGSSQLTLLPESQRRLEEYLRVVLPHYIVMPEGEEEIDQIPFEDLMRLAAQWQREHPDEKLAEPMVWLPYKVPAETKAMLQELANAEGVSMAQFIARLIDKEYEKVVK